MPSRPELTHADLFTERSIKVRQMLDGFAAESITVQPKTAIGCVRILVSNQFTQHQDVERKRFLACNELIYASYYEEWIPKQAKKSQIYLLRRAYMNAYLVDERGTESEFAALHCDLDDDDKHKLSPHLHLWVVGEPLNHAHIPLNLGHLSQVISSTSKLTKAMRSALLMMKREVIDRYYNFSVSA